jgi:hypothetical protein
VAFAMGSLVSGDYGPVREFLQKVK